MFFNFIYYIIIHIKKIIFFSFIKNRKIIVYIAMVELYFVAV